MKVEVACCHCGKKYQATPEVIGKRRTCKQCGKEFDVRDSATPGSVIYRHKERQRDFELAIGDEKNLEAISDHIEKHLGPIAWVYHEMISDLVHIDIHVIEPSDAMPFWKLVTSGMSDRPMTVPEGAENRALAELVFCLPSTWKLNQQSLEDENNYWPLRLMKVLARFPHEYETWLGPAHTIPNDGENPVPYARNTKFLCAILMPAAIAKLPSGLSKLVLSEDHTIHFYSIWPLYKEEMDFKLTHGVEELLDRLESVGATEVLDLQRPNGCAKSPWWKFW